MKFRICVLALAASLLIGLSAPAAQGAETPLSAVRTYREQFVDVAPGDWYHSAVQALYELGLVNGKGSPDHFAPEDNMAVSEVLTLAARLHSLYGNGQDVDTAGDGLWYQPYVAYLQKAGVIGQEFAGRYELAATRAEMAHVLANVLPQDSFTPQNRAVVTSARSSGLFIQDVGPSTDYEADIILLYDWGILSGTDESGSFLPNQPIRRCEVAVMTARLIYEELRLTLDWKVPPPYLWKGKTMADLVTSSGTFHQAPAPGNTEQIAADVRYMLSRGERSITLHYAPGELNSSMINNVIQAFLNEARQYVEQTYNGVSGTASPQTGLLVIDFSSSLYEDDRLEYYRQRTLEDALAIRNQLWEEGLLTEDMSDYDKAQVYFTWICDNCDYDFSAVGSEDSMSHSGWRVFEEGLAVCDGYTAAYNLLLKLEGIDCGTYTMASRNHIWTIAELDGKTYHIDTTWGDQTGQIAYRFFGMTEAESLARFS